MNLCSTSSSREIRKGVFQLAWPSITEQMLIMMVGIVSMIMVGHIGKEAIVAVGMVNMLIFFIQAVFAALSTGATVLVARLTGEEDMSKAREATLQSVIIAVVSSVLMMLLCYIFTQPILRLFLNGAEQSVLALSLVFYQWTIISLPFLIVNIVVGGAFRGAGDTRTPMYVSIIVNIINVVLGFILIIGIGPMKSMGVFGAAIAITVSRGVGGLLLLGILYFGNTPIRLHLKDGFRINVDMIRRIFHVGLPASLEQIVMQGGFLIMQVIVISMGTVASAVYQISNSINSIAFMPIFGFAIAVITLTGQHLGRKDPEMAERCAIQTLYICLAVISTLGILLFIFAKQLMYLYTNDPEVVALGIVIIRILSFGEPLLAVLNVMAAVLRGAGDIKYIMYTSIIGIWCFRIVITYIMHRFFGIGVVGVWIAIVIDFIIRACLYWFRFRAGKWKTIQV